MKRLALAALLIATPLAWAQQDGKAGATAQKAIKTTDVPLPNADFEEPMNGAEIPGWVMLQHAGDPAYEMVVEKRNPAQGKQAARITRTKEEWWGLLQKRIPAPPPGSKIEFSAMMRTDDVGPLGWRLYVHFQEGGHAIREVQTEPMKGTTKWQRVTIREEVPDDTRELLLGVGLYDSGTGWIDDVRLRVIDDGNTRPLRAPTHPFGLPLRNKDKPKDQAKP